MIALWFVNVVTAATPADLAALMPDAQAQLETCAEQGCAPDEGAHAAWVVSLEAYLSTGAADGELSATVRVLAPDLFDSLPDVLQQAATEPAGWAVASVEPDSTQSPPVPPRPVPPRDLETIEGYAPQFHLTVVDSAGEPIPGGNVRFADERDLHRVNTITGRWSGSVRYLPDGGERAFQKGDQVDLEVFAAGYGYTRQRVTMQKRRKNALTVVLTPKTFEAHEGAPPTAEHAVEAWRRWVEADRAVRQETTSQTHEALYEARREASELAREWMDLGGGEDALELCLMTGSLALCGQ